MKKFSKWLIPIVFIGITAVFFSNCKKTAEKASYTCTDVPTQCGNIKCCANSTGSGYYEVNGTKYEFTSSTIQSAATAAATAACSKKTSAELLETQSQIEDFTGVLIEGAKLE